MARRLNPHTGLIEDGPDTSAGGPMDVGGAIPTQRGTFGGAPTATPGLKPPTRAPADAAGGANLPRNPVGPAQGRTAPTPWAGATAVVPPPPPPIPAPVAAPNFQAIAAGMKPATMGPQYQTADKAFQGEELLPDLNDFSRDWMANYNPLNSGYGATARAGSDARLRKMEQDQEIGREEWAASRGLVGSSYEGDMKVAGDESLRRTALDEEQAIMEMIANYELMGRQGAGAFGLGVGEFGRGLGNDRRQEGQYSHEADRTRSRDFEDDSRYRTDTALEAAGMESDAGLNRYLADLEARRMVETGLMDRAQLGLDRDDLSQRGWRDNAGVQIDYDRMGQDDARYASDLAENQRQYDGDSGFRDRELAAKTKAQEEALLMELLDGGLGEITPEMIGWVKEKYGVDLPAAPGAPAAPDPANPTASGVYKTKPTAPPKGKNAGDGRWNKGPMGWTWTDDKQDWWNPGDWLD